MHLRRAIAHSAGNKPTGEHSQGAQSEPVEAATNRRTSRWLRDTSVIAPAGGVPAGLWRHRSLPRIQYARNCGQTDVSHFTSPAE